MIREFYYVSHRPTQKQNFMERMETVEWGSGDSGSTDEKEKQERKRKTLES
jgi:hypothetical protein